MSRNRVISIAVALVVCAAGGLRGETLGVSRSTFGSGVFGYGGTQMPQFTAATDAAFGGSGNVTVIPNVSGSLALFSALMIDIRDFNAGSGANTLSAAEATNLAAFIASGHRVLVFGEDHGNFSTWDYSFLGVLGSSSFNNSNLAAGTPLVSNALTAGVNSVQSFSGDGAIRWHLAVLEPVGPPLWSNTKRLDDPGRQHL